MARQRKDDVGHEGRSSTVQHGDSKNPQGKRIAKHERKVDPDGNRLRTDKDAAGNKDHSGADQSIH